MEDATSVLIAFRLSDSKSGAGRSAPDVPVSAAKADSEREPRLDNAKRIDASTATLKAELALLRAFLGEEIDAILRDKD